MGLEPGEIIRGEPVKEAAFGPLGLHRVAHQALEQRVMQGATDFEIRSGKGVFDPGAGLPLAREGEVASLPEQGLRGHLVHIEGREQRFGGVDAAQFGGEIAPLREHLDQKGRRAGFEPEGQKLALVEQQQQIEGVVDRLAQPVITVIPITNPLAVQPFEFRREHGIDIGLGITAERRIAFIDGNIIEVIQPREQADLAEFGHPGEEGEVDVGILALDDGIKTPEPLAHLAGDLGAAEIIKDGFIVFVDQHHHSFASGGMRRLEQFGEAGRQVLWLAAVQV